MCVSVQAEDLHAQRRERGKEWVGIGDEAGSIVDRVRAGKRVVARHVVIGSQGAEILADVLVGIVKSLRGSGGHG